MSAKGQEKPQISKRRRLFLFIMMINAILNFFLKGEKQA